MLYSFLFFITQWYSPSPGDWTEQVKLDLDDLNIQCDFYYIEKKSTDSFKRLVKRKAKDLAIENLQKKKSIHSKLDNLTYVDLNTQEYLLSNKFSNSEKKTIFKYRTRMERFGENYQGGKPFVMCPICKLHLDNQSMSRIKENDKMQQSS